MQRVLRFVDLDAPRSRRPAWPYGVAVLGSMAAAAVSPILSDWSGVHLPFLLGMGVALLAARTGGLWPGVIAGTATMVLTPLTSAAAIPPANTAAIGVFSFAMAVASEQLLRLKERALAESWRCLRRETLLDRLFQSLPAPILFLESGGSVISGNTAAARLFGAAPGELAGMRIDELLLLAANADPLVELGALAARQRMTGELVTGLTAEGGRLELMIAMEHTVASDHDVTALYLRDETNSRRAAEQQAVLSAQVEQMGRAIALGQLGSAIAHELNQPLASTVNFLGAARALSARGETEAAAEASGDALRQVFRASAILRRLRRFVQAETPDFEWLDARGVIDEALKLAASALRQVDATVTCEVGDGVGELQVDRVQVQQVLLNLLVNASEAVAGRDERRIGLTLSAVAGGSAVIAVTDTGPGVPAAVRAHLFQPFNSSKINGVGVGLSISRSIVEQHGGRLWHEDEAGGGSRFAFTLPHRSLGENSDAA